MFSGKTIFISPLDWGLGHATRCVPIIRELKKENKIILGITPLTKTVFEEEFPELEKIEVPAYDVKYSSTLPLWLKLFFDWPRISNVIKAEKKLLDELISKHKIDVVISDNRFGLYSNKIHSVFITHQLFLKTPFATGIAQNKNKKYIQNFNEVWIPDYESDSDNLSGELSHGNHFHKNVKYIGPQTRLQKNNSTEIKYDYLFLLSGPEPQHTILKNILLEKAKKNSQLKFALVTNSEQKNIPEWIDVFVSPTSQKLSEIIALSKKIICRSGYSTLMDLHLLGKKDFIFIPTSGQTEQEYLAKYWSEKQGAYSIKQGELHKLQF